MKKSEMIVTGELLLIAGLGAVAFGKVLFNLEDRVNKLEKQQIKTIEHITGLAKQIVK